MYELSYSIILKMPTNQEIRHGVDSSFRIIALGLLIGTALIVATQRCSDNCRIVVSGDTIYGYGQQFIDGGRVNGIRYDAGNAPNNIQIGDRVCP